MKPFIISLCDVTGYMVKPWTDAGYNAVLVDPQHRPGVSFEMLPTGAFVYRVGEVINHPDTMALIRSIIERRLVAFVAGFPPCTDVAVSGARWFDAKRQEDPHFQAKAALVAEQCRTIGQLSGAPWFFENPVSVFSAIFGPPTHTFDPCDFGNYLAPCDQHPEYPAEIPAHDAYRKKTCLWTGGGFQMPPIAPVFGLPFQEAFKLGGKGERTKKIRSCTPRGFALAVFLHNQPKAANDDTYRGGELARAL